MSTGWAPDWQARHRFNCQDAALSIHIEHDKRINPSGHTFVITQQSVLMKKELKKVVTKFNNLRQDVFIGKLIHLPSPESEEEEQRENEIGIYG